jgi:hypothetical protein
MITGQQAHFSLCQPHRASENPREKWIASGSPFVYNDAPKRNPKRHVRQYGRRRGVNSGFGAGQSFKTLIFLLQFITPFPV